MSRNNILLLMAEGGISQFMFINFNTKLLKWSENFMVNSQTGLVRE